jgi:hypothetical protein
MNCYSVFPRSLAAGVSFFPSGSRRGFFLAETSAPVKTAAKIIETYGGLNWDWHTFHAQTLTAAGITELAPMLVGFS